MPALTNLCCLLSYRCSLTLILVLQAAAHAQMHRDAARAGSRLHPTESSATLSLQGMYSAGFGVGVRPSGSLSPSMSGMSWQTYGSGGVRVGGANASTALDGSPGLALSNYDVSRSCGLLPSNSRHDRGMGMAHMSRHDAGVLYLSQPHLHRGRAPGPHAHSYGFPAAYAQSFNPNAQTSADLRLPWDGGGAGGGGAALSNLSGSPLQVSWRHRLPHPVPDYPRRCKRKVVLC